MKSVPSANCLRLQCVFVQICENANEDDSICGNVAIDMACATSSALTSLEFVSEELTRLLTCEDIIDFTDTLTVDVCTQNMEGIAAKFCPMVCINGILVAKQKPQTLTTGNILVAGIYLSFVGYMVAVIAMLLSVVVLLFYLGSNLSTKESACDTSSQKSNGRKAMASTSAHTQRARAIKILE